MYLIKITISIISYFLKIILIKIDLHYFFIAILKIFLPKKLKFLMRFKLITFYLINY